MGKFAKGVNSEIKFIFESDEGITPSGAKSHSIPFNSSSLGSTTNMTDAETITGRRDAVKPIMGNHDVNGSLTVPLDTNILGLFFTAAFGAPTSTSSSESITGGASAIQHVFKVGQDMPSFTIQQGLKDIDQYDIFSGCKINTISLEIGGDGELTADIDIMGMSHTSANSDTYSTAANPAIGMKRVVALDAVEVLLGGQAVGTATNFSINMDFGLDGDSYFLTKDGYRGTISEGIFTATGTLTCMLPKTYGALTASQIFSAIEDGKETSLSVKCKTIEGRSISFAFPEVLFEEVTPGIEGPRGVSVELNYHAYRDDNSDASSVVVTLINEVAATGYALPS